MDSYAKLAEKRPTAPGRALEYEINRAEHHMEKVRLYWEAVADDLGPETWRDPTNPHRKNYEQEISLACHHFQNLLQQVAMTRIADEHFFGFEAHGFEKASTSEIRDRCGQCGRRERCERCERQIRRMRCERCERLESRENLDIREKNYRATSRKIQPARYKTIAMKDPRQPAEASQADGEPSTRSPWQSASLQTPLDSSGAAARTESTESFQNRSLTIHHQLIFGSRFNGCPGRPIATNRPLAYEHDDDKENNPSLGSQGFQTTSAREPGDRFSRTGNDGVDEDSASTLKEQTSYLDASAEPLQLSNAAKIDNSFINEESHDRFQESRLSHWMSIEPMINRRRLGSGGPRVAHGVPVERERPASLESYDEQQRSQTNKISHPVPTATVTPHFLRKESLCWKNILHGDTKPRNPYFPV